MLNFALAILATLAISTTVSADPLNPSSEKNGPKYESFQPCQQWAYDSNSGAQVCRWVGMNLYVYDMREVDQLVSQLERRIDELERRIQTLENQ